METILSKQKVIKSDSSKIRELILRYGKKHYSHRIDVMREHVELVINNPTVDKDIRSVLEDVSYVLGILSNDIKEGRV